MIFANACLTDITNSGPTFGACWVSNNPAPAVLNVNTSWLFLITRLGSKSPLTKSNNTIVAFINSIHLCKLVI